MGSGPESPYRSVRIANCYPHIKYAPTTYNKQQVIFPNIIILQQYDAHRRMHRYKHVSYPVPTYTMRYLAILSM